MVSSSLDVKRRQVTAEAPQLILMGIQMILDRGREGWVHHRSSLPKKTLGQVVALGQKIFM